MPFQDVGIGNTGVKTVVAGTPPVVIWGVADELTHVGTGHLEGKFRGTRPPVTERPVFAFLRRMVISKVHRARSGTERSPRAPLRRKAFTSYSWRQTEVHRRIQCSPWSDMMPDKHVSSNLPKIRRRPMVLSRGTSQARKSLNGGTGRTHHGRLRLPNVKNRQRSRGTRQSCTARRQS